jgi:UDP-N-acetylmuramoyl-tripeptide--D-alanyl-D-alanine ligase
MIEQIYKYFLKCDRKVSIDSRNIIPGSIFFALQGANFDGNKFAQDAIDKGAAWCIIDNKKFESDRTILVGNVLETLQQLAKHYRNNCPFKVLAITGTNGKTTTKELIKAVLSVKYNCAATSGNFNNHIGVPLTILNTPPNTDILVVEMGANHVGEINTLCQIALPDYGIITNIGKAHLEGFGGFENVIKAKSELYYFLIKNNKPVFVHDGDNILTGLLNGYNQQIRYGTSDTDCYADNIKFNGKLFIEAIINLKKNKISTQLFGKYNVSNILAALCIGQYFTVDIKHATDEIEKYIPQNNRSQIKTTLTNTLILDSYNANPTSMEVAIESFLEIETENKTVILGEMMELGKYTEEEHLKLFNRISEEKELQGFFIGKNFYTLNSHYTNTFYNTNDFIEYLRTHKLENKLILLKGSRTNKLELLLQYL